MKKMFSALIVLSSLTAPAMADVSVTAPWVRATVPAQKSSGAFMRLESSTSARLVSVSSPVAAQVELHQMDMKDGMMKMQQVDGIDLPAGKGVNLASGSYHIMLVGLKHQLKAGDAINLTLQVEHPGKKLESITVKVPVKPINFAVPEAGMPAAH
jgi:periplasmic copper chaperone A